MAGKPARPANAIDQTRRMLSLVTYLRERPGARVEDVARAFGITEDELISDLDVLPMCGTSFRGGDLLDIDTDGDRIWWHNPDDVRRAAAARRRRGDRAAGRRPRRGHAARAARERPAGAAAGHRQAGGRGRRGGRGQLPAVGDLRVRGRRLRRRRPGDLRAAPAVDPLLLARARRAHRARDRPDPAVRRRAHLRGGLVPPLRGAPHLPARPGRRDQAPRRAVRAAARSSCGTCPRGWCSPRPRIPRSSSRSGPAAAGSPSTTRTTARRSWPTAGCGSPCAPPTRPRCAGWRCGSAGTAGSSRRRSSPTAPGRRPGRRWRPTTGRGRDGGRRRRARDASAPRPVTQAATGRRTMRVRQAGAGL